MQATGRPTVSCPACGEANRAEARFCRACGTAVAGHANTHAWISRIALAFSLLALVVVAFAAGIALDSPYDGDESVPVISFAALFWLVATVVEFCFRGWSPAGLRARRSWASVVVGILSRVIAFTILLMLAATALGFSQYYYQYDRARDAASTYRRQLEKNNIKPEGPDPYYY